jgi:hypothetical protein
MSEELKPCPFCGQTHTNTIRITPVKRDDDGNEIQGDPYYAVRLDCLHPHYKWEIPLTMWNTRPIEDELRARAEHAEKYACELHAEKQGRGS